MKNIVLVALLVAAGCSKKGPDCSAAIGKGIDRYLDGAKQTAAGSPRGESTLKLGDKLKAAMTQRCTDDKWQTDVVVCFGNVVTSADLKACQDRLTRDQRTKLDNVVFPIMMGGMGVNGARMPPGLAGHPPMLAGSASGSGDAPGSAAPPAGEAVNPGAAAGSGAAPAAGSGAAPAAGSAAGGGW
jgi:hypothetical protein